MTVEASAINLARMLRFKGVSELNVTNWPPAADEALVAGLPVGIVGFREKARFNRQIQAGFVGEVDADAVITEFGGELHAFDDFAFGLGKAKNFPDPGRGASDLGLWFGCFRLG